jgi:hypothetical protein
MAGTARGRAERKGNPRDADECGHVDISRGFAPQKKKQGKKAKPRSDFRHVEETATQRQPRRTDHSGATALDSHQLPGFAAAIVLVSVLASVLASRYARPAAYRPDHYGFVSPYRNRQDRCKLEMIYYNIQTVFLFVHAALSALCCEAFRRLLIAGFP